MTRDTGEGSRDTPQAQECADGPQSAPQAEAEARAEAGDAAAEAAEEVAEQTEEEELELPPPSDAVPGSRRPPPKPTPPSFPVLPKPPPPSRTEGIDLPPPASVPLPAPISAPRVVPPAIVEELSPDHGPILGGTKVTVSGDHLYRESIVRFDGVIATPIGANEPRVLRIVAPPRSAPGTVEISVQNPGSKIVILPQAFRYDPLPPPKIISVAPNRGRVAGGTELTITGENFVADTVVLLDGEPAEPLARFESTTIDVKTPPGQAGLWLDVVVRNPDGKQDKAPRAFQYDERYR